MKSVTFDSLDIFSPSHWDNKSYVIHNTENLLIEVLHGNHVDGRNNRFFFLWGKMFFLMQTIFIVPTMPHGSCAKPLSTPTYQSLPCMSEYNSATPSLSFIKEHIEQWKG